MAQIVVLFHGIARTRRSMAKLERFLQDQGFVVYNLDYPSRFYDLADLAARMQPIIEDALQQPYDQVHFVGYSMGGLLIRTLLNIHRPERLGRVVMLGTPNQGSEVADALKKNWLYRRFYGPAGQQLITQQQDFAHLFGPIDFPLGVIAGNKPIDPFCSWLIGRGQTDKANDGKVSIASTKINGMQDHIVIPVSHTFMPVHADVLRQTVHFLQHGAFAHAASKPST